MSLFLLQQVFLHEDKTHVTFEPSAKAENLKKSNEDSAAKQGLPGGERVRGRRHGGRRAHSQMCKQVSFRPAPGRVRKAVRHMEGPIPLSDRPPLQHRLSVAQLADAALVVSRTREFEGQINPNNSDKMSSPSPPEHQPGEDTALCSLSQSRRMVRQASVDVDPSLG